MTEDDRWLVEGVEDVEDRLGVSPGPHRRLRGRAGPESREVDRDPPGLDEDRVEVCRRAPPSVQREHGALAVATAEDGAAGERGQHGGRDRVDTEDSSSEGSGMPRLPGKKPSIGPPPMADTSTEDPSREPLAHFQGAALRRATLITWLVLLLVVAQGIRHEVEPTTGLAVVGSAFVVGLALASIVDWRKALASDVGSWAAWAFCVFLTLSLGAMAALPELFETAVPMFAGVVVLTGLVLERVRHVFVSILAVFLLGVAAFRTGNAGDLESLVIPALTVAVVAAATAVLGTEFTREARRSADRLRDLQAQREDFERLYAVSKTISGVESLEEGLPQIVGRICRFVGAQVGVVFLHEEHRHVLRVVSPMWVNGNPLEVTRLDTPISGSSALARVFRSGRPTRIRDVGRGQERAGVLTHLGLQEAIVAPLRVERENVGVIVVADPTEGVFDDLHVESVTSLAGAAALVLSQLGRYEQAAELSRRMSEIAQMKTDFVSVVSHELRSPLTSIIGSLDTISRPELPPDLSSELLESARRQAGRLQRLIEDLLMVSRIDRHAVPITAEDVELGTLLRETANVVTSVERLTVDPSVDDHVVRGDPDHLGRVFINLLENAGKYAPGSPVEIVAEATDDGRVAISVVDHGEGIPPEARERVFERFTQLERADTRTRGGTGLGLSVVSGLVEAMDGAVSLSETPGGGATFTVELPRGLQDAVSRSA